jgi:hypothetical protein
MARVLWIVLHSCSCGMNLIKKRIEIQWLEIIKKNLYFDKIEPFLTRLNHFRQDWTIFDKIEPFSTRLDSFSTRTNRFWQDWTIFDKTGFVFDRLNQIFPWFELNVKENGVHKNVIIINYPLHGIKSYLHCLTFLPKGAAVTHWQRDII